MRDGPEPTLRDVILTLERFHNEVAGVRGELTSVRTVLMDRMDRLQNTMAGMREEQIILNGLVLLLNLLRARSITV